MHPTDQGDTLRRPGRECARFMVFPDRPQHIGKSALVAAVDDPRSSGLPAMNVSASSMISVGDHLSTARNTVAGVTLAEVSGLGTRNVSNERSVDLPHSITGDVTVRIGE